MRRSIIACGLLLGFAGIPSAVAAAGGKATPAPDQTLAMVQQAARARTEAHSIAYWSGRAHRARAAAARWLTVIRGRPPRQRFARRTIASAQKARSLARFWRRRAVAASRLAHHPPNLHAWYCIHSYEGSWTDPNAPYWGGLQMDYSFQSAYGAWLLKHEGTADHWTPLEQIWAGVRAWRVRGFGPWPNTARMCGV